MNTATVGSRIRALREAKGLSLRDLAGLSRVSAPMLSQVERGETSPTLAVATKIASGLELTLSQLLRLDERPHVSVVRRTQRRKVLRDGHRYEELTPGLPGERASVSLHALEVGGRTATPGDPPMHSPGSRETAVVESGEIALLIGEERFVVREGDAATFDADIPHHFENTGTSVARFYAVVTEGLRGG
jgi:transcriptional regulator with XRE-family HTH domain